MKKEIMVFCAAGCLSICAACSAQNGAGPWPEQKGMAAENRVELPELNTERDSSEYMPSGVPAEMEEQIVRTDFPLIDIYFYEEDQWLLVNYRMWPREIVNGEISESGVFEIVTDRDILERNKEYLSVSTIPIGRGTTPNGRIVVYKNGEWYKSVQYLGGVDIYSDTLKNAFQRVSEEEIRNLVSRYPGF